MILPDFFTVFAVMSGAGFVRLMIVLISLVVYALVILLMDIILKNIADKARLAIDRMLAMSFSHNQKLFLDLN